LIAEHDGAPLTAAAAALGLPLSEVEWLVMELVDAGMIERTPVQ
jgi:DNA-binding IclR family transcriptional regulator